MQLLVTDRGKVVDILLDRDWIFYNNSTCKFLLINILEFSGLLVLVSILFIITVNG